MINYFFSVKNEVKNKINITCYYLILGYIISLYINNAPVLTNLLMVLLLIFSLFNVRELGFLNSLQQNPACICITVIFFLQLLSVIYSNNKIEGMAIIVQKTPLFIIPLTFCFLSFKKKIWYKIILFYAIVTTIASLLGFLGGSYNAVINNDSGFLYNDNICSVFSKQAVYFAWYISVAILVFTVYLNEDAQLKQGYKFYIYIAIIWLFFILFMLASRTSMFALIIIWFWYIGKILVQKKKYIEGALLILSLVIGSVVVSKLFPKTLNRFKGTTEINFQYDNKNLENHFNAAYDKSKWNSSNTRAAIWNCAIEIWEENKLIGTGIGDKTNDLLKKYEDKNFLYGINTKKNTHSQYLDILISTGIIGLIIFIIVFFIYPMFILYKRKQQFAFSIFLLLAICLFTENMFDRYQGLIIISFILPLSTKINHKETISVIPHS
ncbi:MAG: O-antigen ligase family protein [Bacteroidia bacterium]